MALTRQLDELDERVMEAERARKSLQSELDSQLESKDDAGRLLHDLEKSKRSLETQVEEQLTQIEELEDELQTTEDAKLRLEVGSTQIAVPFPFPFHCFGDSGWMLCDLINELLVLIVIVVCC